MEYGNQICHVCMNFILWDLVILKNRLLTVGRMIIHTDDYAGDSIWDRLDVLLYIQNDC